MPSARGGAAQQAEIARREGVGLARRAQGDVLRGPLADARESRAEPRDRLLDRCRAARRARGSASAACASARSAARRALGMPSAARSAFATCAAVGKRQREGARSAASATALRCRRCATSLPASWRAGRDGDLLAEHGARTASSKPSQAPGARRPGRARDQRREHADRGRGARRSRRCRRRGRTRGAPARRSPAARARSGSGWSRRGSSRPATCGDRDGARRAVERDGAAIALAVDLLDAGDRARAQEAEHRRPVVGRAVAQPEGHAGRRDRALAAARPSRCAAARSAGGRRAAGRSR